jgi:acetoin utilization deacetylase AcuC-like enzyme
MAHTGIVYSSVYLAHRTGEHPECPARLVVIQNHLQRSGLWEKFRIFTPRAADIEELRMVHTEEHIFRVQRFCHEGRTSIDPDTAVCPESFDVARTAAGGVFVAIDQVMLREVKNVFCMVRPPGHHAGASEAMGFCLFNNVALGARYAQKHHACRKVLIVDFDAHHGNGTQAIFYEDDSVFYLSMHRFPFYPGTGHESERGKGRGAGFTLNCPVPVSLDRAVIVSLFVKALDDVVRVFVPDFVLVSAGFDGYAGDPIAGLHLETRDFREMTAAIVELAGKCCSGRIVSVLEGGYDLNSLGECVEEHLRALMED